MKTTTTPEPVSCEQVNLTYHIINNACSAKEVTLTETIGFGTFVDGSVVSDDIDLDNASIVISGSGSRLDIGSLLIPGGSQTITIQVAAVVGSHVIQPGTLTLNEDAASLNYTRTEENGDVPVTLNSTDLVNTSNPGITVIKVTYSEKPEPVSVTRMTASETCFLENDELTFTIEVNNENPVAVEDVILELLFNEEFTIKSVTSSTLSVTEDKTAAESGYNVFSYNLPSGPHTLTIVAEAPVRANLAQDTVIDENGNEKLAFDQWNNPIYAQFGLHFTMSSEAADICEQAMFEGAQGAFAIDYCKSVGAVISNKHITGEIPLP
jgi:hypothetical protein